MLWKKEIVDGNSIHVKLHVDADYVRAKSKFRKDSRFLAESDSNVVRARGNQFFGNGDMQLSIDAYCQAILLADVGSMESALSYANRSACFFRLKRFAQCLADIDLAEKNNYPVHLMPKLEQRKSKCLQMMDGDSEMEALVKPELSFPSHPQIPYFVDCLEVRHSENFGKHIVTNRELDIGQTIIIEQAFACTPSGRCVHLCCANCLEMAKNLFPCRQNCKLAMFCSDDCAAAASENAVLCELHKKYIFSANDKMLLQTVLKAIRAFSTFEALMEAIEKFNEDRLNDYTDPAKREYFEFFGLTGEFENLDIERQIRMPSMAMEFYTLIESNLEMLPAPRSIREQRFMLHLLVHHTSVINANGYDADKSHCSPYKIVVGIEDMIKYGAMNRFACGIVGKSSLLNHSCVPNVCRIFLNDSVIFKVIQPIKRNQQLFISYL